MTLGVRWIVAEWHFANARFYADNDELQAFAAATEAYKAMPLSGPYRVQRNLSLGQLSGKKNVKLGASAADRSFQVAATASPSHALILVSRANYLLSSGRWKESDEIQRVVDQLERTAKTYPQTWMVVAAYSGVTGQNERAAKALVAGLEAGGKFADMQRVAHSINMEIEKQ